MKKYVLIAAGVLTALLLYLAFWGFLKNPSCFIADYSLSGDGREMTLTVGVSSSTGYIRRLSVRKEGEQLLIDPISAFGGINGRVGARDSFTLSLDGEIRSIAFYGPEGYKVLLEKTEDGSWERTRN